MINYNFSRSDAINIIFNDLKENNLFNPVFELLLYEPFESNKIKTVKALEKINNELSTISNEQKLIVLETCIKYYKNKYHFYNALKQTFELRETPLLNNENSEISISWGYLYQEILEYLKFYEEHIFLILDNWKEEFKSYNTKQKQSINIKEYEFGYINNKGILVWTATLNQLAFAIYKIYISNKFNFLGYPTVNDIVNYIKESKKIDLLKKKFVSLEKELQRIISSKSLKNNNLDYKEAKYVEEASQVLLELFNIK